MAKCLGYSWHSFLNNFFRSVSIRQSHLAQFLIALAATVCSYVCTEESDEVTQIRWASLMQMYSTRTVAMRVIAFSAITISIAYIWYLLPPRSSLTTPLSARNFHV